LLAGAEPLGRVDLPANLGQAYFFATEVDGKKSDVMVVWSKEETTYELNQTPQACYDHLGRVHSVDGIMLKVGRAPLYAVLADHSRPSLHPPPKPAKWLPGKPSPIVLQVLLPEADILLEKSAYKMNPADPKSVSIFAYNFGPAKTSCRFNVAEPDQWQAEFPEIVELMPGERRELPLKLRAPAGNPWTEAAIRINADCGPAGKAVLSVRLTPGS
jgi:hypothetical protein